MSASYSADLRWRVIWFVDILQNSVAEASFFLGICESTVEYYISKFLVNGDIKPEPVGRISFAPREELIGFCMPNMETTVPFGRAISVRQLPFAVLSDNFFLK